MLSEMYGAKGKLGNKVYYKAASGKTVARELVTPKNPKTDAQTLQRVIASQVGKTYAKLKALCDHSFEGYSNGAQCANRFRQLNMRKVRERAAEIQAAGQSLGNFYNFTPIASEKWLPGAAYIAQGSLTAIMPSIVQTAGGAYVGAISVEDNTYAAVAAALGAKRGDQITFVTVNKSATSGEYEVHFARIILDPRNADGSGASMDEDFIAAGGGINLPNWRNQGAFGVLTIDDSNRLTFKCGQGALVAAGVIASRKVDGKWYRSNSQLVVSEDALGRDKTSLLAAVEGSYAASNIEMESEYYLNNAGTGGSQGSASATPVTPESNDPMYDRTALINGVEQNIAGGSVSATAPVETIVVTGVNLSEAPVTAKLTHDGTDTDLTPAKTATAITFSSIGAVADDTITVKKDGVTMFVVTAVAGGGGDGEDEN